VRPVVYLCFIRSIRRIIDALASDDFLHSDRIPTSESEGDHLSPATNLHAHLELKERLEPLLALESSLTTQLSAVTSENKYKNTCGDGKLGKERGGVRAGETGSQNGSGE